MEFRTESDDFDLLAEEDSDAAAVAVATDVPVHLGLVGVTGKSALVSPFILASQALGLDRTKQLMGRVQELRVLREQLFPAARRAAAFWADRDLEGLTRSLQALPGAQALDWDNDTPMDMFNNVVGRLLGPLEEPSVREASAEELLKIVGIAVHQHFDALADLFSDFDAGALEEHRRRVIPALFGALNDVDAFFPALWAEAMEGKVELEPFRVMRDDFAQRKISYQDLFELASRTLAFTAPIANIVLRGDAKAFSDGGTRTPHKARKAKAFERAKWLVDFPVVRPRYDAVSRHTRNDIGHALVRQDVRDGVLIYGDGTKQNYMLFLVDWLQAVRLAQYTLDVFFVLDYARAVINHRRNT